MVYFHFIFAPILGYLKNSIFAEYICKDAVFYKSYILELWLHITIFILKCSIIRRIVRIIIR